ncbi:MAG: fimbrillin family protein [Muribaculaceae bacterium]|nr:fimbrillin family protein [Muribaculaceae bacterium]
MRIINALMLLSAVGLGFTACSSDDDTPVDGKAMRFNVTVPRAPRAATTTQSINQFNLYSFVDGAEYMSNVTVTRNGTEWEASPAMYCQPREDQFPPCAGQARFQLQASRGFLIAGPSEG